MADGPYDFIIVGAGPAGCVLANRLSATPGHRVALIEAGRPDRAREIRIPAAFSKLFTGPYDWNYRTSKQSAMADREMYWPRGKTLGGSTSINAMMWVRGSRADYDGWGEELPGWSYDDVLPYFNRVERRVGPTKVHGAEGPVWISDLRTPNPASVAFLAACEEYGLHALGELNEPDNSGYALTPVTQHRGRRWSAADAYLVPTAGRPNLDVITGGLVERVELDGDKATGVTYRDASGRRRNLSARREVVLCAGAVNSPQLLMLSGVGDPEHLRAVGVEPRHELLGVGQNLQDHLAAGVLAVCPQPVTMVAAEKAGQVAQYLLRRRGMLTSSVAEGVAFVRSDPALAAPDLELVFAPVPFVEHGAVPPTEHGVTLGVVLLQPASRGRVTLAGPDPAATPIIDPEYLSDPADVKTMIAGLRIAEDLLATDAMKPFVGGPLAPWPGKVDDATLEQQIREHAETLYHPVGTCRMGLGAGAVVDGELKVHGLRGLRVVDASVIPRIPRGHTQAPVYMIAERAAEFIQA
jgi:choline dehydrogenase